MTGMVHTNRLWDVPWHSMPRKIDVPMTDGFKVDMARLSRKVVEARRHTHHSGVVLHRGHIKFAGIYCRTCSIPIVVLER